MADGALDLWVTDYQNMTVFMRNAGKQGFEDISARSGISAATEAQYVSWGSGIYDFDNDGSAGHSRFPRRA